MKIVGIRMDDDTLNALDVVIDNESKKRLHRVTASECIRYVILKEAVSIKQDNKKT